MLKNLIIFKENEFKEGLNLKKEDKNIFFTSNEILYQIPYGNFIGEVFLYDEESFKQISCFPDLFSSEKLIIENIKPITANTLIELEEQGYEVTKYFLKIFNYFIPYNENIYYDILNYFLDKNLFIQEILFKISKRQFTLEQNEAIIKRCIEIHKKIKSFGYEDSFYITLTECLLNLIKKSQTKKEVKEYFVFLNQTVLKFDYYYRTDRNDNFKDRIQNELSRFMVYEVLQIENLEIKESILTKYMTDCKEVEARSKRILMENIIKNQDEYLYLLFANKDIYDKYENTDKYLDVYEDIIPLAYKLSKQDTVFIETYMYKYFHSEKMSFKKIIFYALKTDEFVYKKVINLINKNFSNYMKKENSCIILNKLIELDRIDLIHELLKIRRCFLDLNEDQAYDISDSIIHDLVKLDKAEMIELLLIKTKKYNLLNLNGFYTGLLEGGFEEKFKDNFKNIQEIKTYINCLEITNNKEIKELILNKLFSFNDDELNENHKRSIINDILKNKDIENFNKFWNKYITDKRAINFIKNCLFYFLSESIKHDFDIKTIQTIANTWKEEVIKKNKTSSFKDYNQNDINRYLFNLIIYLFDKREASLDILKLLLEMIPPRRFHLDVFNYIFHKNRYEKDKTELSYQNLEKYQDELIVMFKPYLWLDCE